MINRLTSHLRILILLLITVAVAGNIYATPPDTLWTKTYGGSNIDIGYSVKQTNDGGYIITGYTFSYGAMSGHNIWLIKTDSAGTLQWDTTYGGNAEDHGLSVIQTSDGAYLLTGYTKSYGSGGADVILIKTDPSGHKLWERIYGGTSDEEGYGVVEAVDGTYLIAGATSSFGAGSRDVWLIKTDTTGNEIWKKTFGGFGSDGARDIQATADGGCIITGWTYSYGPGAIGNVWLLKVNAAGTQEWNKYFGGTDADRGLSVKVIPGVGYILTGYTASSGAGLDDMLLIKTDNLGNQIWYKTFGGSGRDYGNSIDLANDGGYIIAGYTLSSGAGGDDLWIVKTDSAGIEQWSKTYGGTASDVGNSVRQTSDAGIIVTGHTLSFGAGLHDVWLIRLAPPVPVELISFSGSYKNYNVQLQWSTATETNNKGFQIETKLSGSDNWQAIGFVEGNGTTTTVHNYHYIDTNITAGVVRYRLKQIDLDGSFEYSSIVEIEPDAPGSFSLKQNYPNPFNPSTIISYSIPENSRIKLTIFNVLGEEMAILVNEEQAAGSYNLTWNAQNMPAGIYYYSISADNFSETKKMVLLK